MERIICHLGRTAALLLAIPAILCCNKDSSSDEPVSANDSSPVLLEDFAKLLSSLDIGSGQVGEVYDAVSSSSGNGYDEEYTMRDLFASPGAGVGDTPSTKASKAYDVPLRDLIADAVRSRTKADGGNQASASAEQFLQELSSSDIQIYWPYSDSWSEDAPSPIITYDPMDGSDISIGYFRDSSGTVNSFKVTEETARRYPVWVINRNNDAEFRSLELLRRSDPSWGHGGGDIIVRHALSEYRPHPVPGATASAETGFAPQNLRHPASSAEPATEIRTLILRSFKANRHFDSWLAGASEFFIKCGSVENFVASTEAELRLYEPSITDFMIVVKRSQVGEEMPFNAVLVSEWTPALQSCAMMVTEDDGGSRTDWKCSAVVKYNSKSYGIEISIPLNSRDDIVWRGQLSANYIQKYSGTVGHFGDIDVVLELI